ncbi:XRE family transcriptional regulator [Amycolatopsis sp. CA-230715]|uniref:XRE family transcriptional regulator n=1 Tax=Amycolatopsis sp. CA-230715 TaxID=2745196 RepID=UPI0020B29EC5|nr:XRE family transcriptional regulator [Amycolatopsis sp. CA-230715]
MADANYIGKLERGVIRWPSALYREALRGVLGAATDGALGFTNRRRTVVKLADVDRKKFLRGVGLGVGALTLAPVAARFQGSEPTPVPSRVGSAEIGQIATAAKVFAGWDHTYGGGLAREAVQAQLHWSAGLLDASCHEALRGPLRSAIGYLAHTCGFMAFDAYKHADATNAFEFGLACAEEAGDWHLRAKILSSMARQAIWRGYPDDGLTSIEHALVRADRLTATERAMLYTAHARALAKMRRTREALAAVGRADEEFAHATPANDPPWMAYYDHAQHVGDTGHALFDLAVLGYRPVDAAARLADAVTGHTDAYPRSRAISQTKLATLTMATGDPAEAAVIGQAALDAAGTVRSRRAADDLRELSRYAHRHSRTPEVAALRQRIHTVLAAS